MTKPLNDETDGNNEVILPNNTEIQIEELRGIKFPLDMRGWTGPAEIPVYQAYVRYANPYSGNWDYLQVKILHPKVERYYKQYLQFLVAKARKAEKDNSSATWIWEEFYKLKERTFIFFNHDYVRTIHSSQGSTFHLTMTDYKDIRKALTHNRNASLFRKMEYVAYTRNRKGNISLM